MISKNTATEILVAYREIESAENMLQEIKEHLGENAELDIRDNGGNKRYLELHIPSFTNMSSYSVRYLTFDVAINVLTEHIEAMNQKLKKLKSVCNLELREK